MKTFTPAAFSLFVLPLSFASLPCMVYPIWWRIRANPDTPWPPMPTKWIRPIEGGNASSEGGFSYERVLRNSENDILIKFCLIFGYDVVEEG